MAVCAVARLFLSTPSARRATGCFLQHRLQLRISIHALREEGDPACPDHLAVDRNFYPRPPRGGRRYPIEIVEDATLFLSTPSARRATLAACYKGGDILISIHALREEGDSKNRDKISIFKQIIQHSARI